MKTLRWTAGAVLILAAGSGMAYISTPKTEIALKEKVAIKSLDVMYFGHKPTRPIDATDPSTYGIQAFSNPYSLTVVDSNLFYYRTFAGNGHLLKWQNGFAVQMTDKTTYLCPSETLDKNECVRVYSLTRNSPAKSNLVEF